MTAIWGRGWGRSSRGYLVLFFRHQARWLENYSSATSTGCSLSTPLCYTTPLCFTYQCQVLSMLIIYQSQVPVTRYTFDNVNICGLESSESTPARVVSYLSSYHTKVLRRCRACLSRPSSLCSYFCSLTSFPDTCGLFSSSVEVSVFKYQPGLQTPVEQLHNYRISSRGAAITGSLTQSEERRGENVSGSVDIAAGTISRLISSLYTLPGGFLNFGLDACSEFNALEL